MSDADSNRGHPHPPPNPTVSSVANMKRIDLEKISSHEQTLADRANLNELSKKPSPHTMGESSFVLEGNGRAWWRECESGGSVRSRHTLLESLLPY